MFLARKISLAKWGPGEGLSDGAISADAVTADLRTSDNALSLWDCGDATDVAVDEAVLAIASVAQRVEKIDVAWLARRDLEDEGLPVEATPGHTCVPSLVDQHVDVCALDLTRLSQIARRVAAAVESGRCCRRTRKRVAKLLATAVAARRVRLDALEKKVRAEVVKLLPNDGG